MAQGDYDGACPKFAESQRLDPGSGTLTALALCHAGQGKTASAWAEFMEVVATARRDGRADREKFARARAAELEPSLSRLTIVVPPEVSRIPGLSVVRDGEEVGAPAWGSALPIDPGDHVVEVTARGKSPWKTTVNVGPKGDKRSVSVPVLEDASTLPLPPGSFAATVTPAAEEHRGMSRTQLAGFVLGGAGLVVLGVGSYFGIEAVGKSSDSKAICPLASCNAPTAISDNNAAKTDAFVADFAIGAGVVAIGVGAVLVLTSHGSTAASPSRGSRLVPMVGRDGGGLLWIGPW
jgi:hypothetical protein